MGNGLEVFNRIVIYIIIVLFLFYNMYVFGALVLAGQQERKMWGSKCYTVVYVTLIFTASRTNGATVPTLWCLGSFFFPSFLERFCLLENHGLVISWSIYIFNLKIYIFIEVLLWICYSSLDDFRNSESYIKRLY